MGFFEAVVTATGAGVVDDLMEAVFAEKPVEGGFHFQAVIVIFEDIVEAA